jgi:hypothetical protein
LNKLSLRGSPQGLKLASKGEYIVNDLFCVSGLGCFGELAKQETIYLSPFTHLNRGELSKRPLDTIVGAPTRRAVKTESSTALLNECHNAGYKRLGFHNLAHQKRKADCLSAVGGEINL